MNLRTPSDPAFAAQAVTAWPETERVLAMREWPAKMTRETLAHFGREAKSNPGSGLAIHHYAPTPRGAKPVFKCASCNERPAVSRGLCSRCYQRAWKANL